MSEHVFPAWAGRFLANPLWKLYQNPATIIGGHIGAGDFVLEVGPGMGFFTLPMARLVGESGNVLAVDVQEAMLRVLADRAARASLAGIVMTKLCSAASLDLADYAGRADFALLFAVVHEIPDKADLFGQTFRTLKRGGKALMAEPLGHVSEDGLKTSVGIAEEAGFRAIGNPAIRGCRSVLLEKPAV
jgi:ubiquinone/menaquinone biosynthesis C-methylase UbiE